MVPSRAWPPAIDGGQNPIGVRSESRRMIHRGDHLDITRYANSGLRQRFTALLPVCDFIADDAAQFSIDLLLALPVTNAAEVEVGAVADVELILVRPADEAVILVGGFHVTDGR